MKILLLVLCISLLLGCASNWSKKTDQECIRGWYKYSWGRAVAMDVLLTGGFTTLRTANQREAIRIELEQRGYVLKDGRWVKERIP